MYMNIIYSHTLREVDRNKKYCIYCIVAGGGGGGRGGEGGGWNVYTGHWMESVKSPLRTHQLRGVFWYRNTSEQNRTELFIWLFQPGDFSRYHASHHIIHKPIQYSKIYRQ